MARLMYLESSALSQNDALAPYRNLTDAGLRAKEAKGELGRFIAEGPLVVREALLRSREETRAGRPGILRSILIDAATIADFILATLQLPE